MSSTDSAIRGEVELLVTRSRLLRVFDEFERGARIIGLWAPAGAGKSTLLHQWLDTVTDTVCFADATDEAQVIRAIAAAQSVESDRVYLAIDQLDRATSRSRDAIMSVIDTGSSRLRTVLAGRFDPLPASPARWAWTREIRAADLAFTADEAAQLLGRDATHPTDEQLRQILTRTGGWAAGLVLLRHLLDGRDDDAVIDGFNGDNRSVAEYLVSELLSRLSADDSELLIWSAVGPVVPTAVAATVTQRSDAGSILEDLARTNSLITRHDDAYLFHPILCSFLTAEQRRRDIQRARRGHALAAAWFAERLDLLNAIEQRVLADDPAALAEFIEKHGYELIFRGESGRVMRAVRELAATDRERLEADMRLLLDIPHFADREGAAHRLRVRSAADPGAVRTVVDEIIDVLWAHAVGQSAAVPSLLGASPSASARRSREMAFLLEYTQTWTRAFVDDDDRYRACETLVRLGAPTESTANLRWLRLLALESALSVVAMSARWIDVEPVFLAIARELIGDADITDSVSARAVFSHAAQAFHRGDPLPTSTLRRLSAAEGSAIEPGMQHVARTLLALDDLPRHPGIESLNSLTDVIENDLADTVASLAYAVIPWIHSAMWNGNGALADRILFRCRRVLGPSSLESHTAAFVRRPSRETAQSLREALAANEPKSSPLALSYAWIALAVHADQRGRDTAATEAILNALMCAMPLDAVRPFLQEGNAPATVLRPRIERLGAWRPLAEAVLAHEDTALRHEAAPALTAALTARERDLLRELPAHQSITEIAARRQVTVNTIKSQLRSIYSKLNVSGRTEAVDSARSLGLL